MFDSLLQHSNSALLMLRIVIGIIFLYHGTAKWTMKGSKGMMALIMAVLKVVEPIIGILLILGIYTQESGLVAIIIMIGAIVAKIFMFKTPFSANNKTGWEFDLLILAGAVALLLTDAGSTWF